ncbi:hypothetical protein BOX15_Mlig011037g1, partial [Macrostomum lignano]
IELTTRRVTTFDGSSVRIEGEVRTKIRFGEIEIETEFLLCNHECDDILGMEFFMNFCDSISLSRGMLVLKEGTCIPIQFTKLPVRVCRIYSHNSVTIPANSALRIPIRMTKGSEANYGTPMVIDTIGGQVTTKRNSLEMIPTLVTMNDGTGVVEIINRQNDDIRLTRSTLIGVAKPLKPGGLAYSINSKGQASSDDTIRTVKSEESEYSWINEIDLGEELTSEQKGLVIDLLKKNKEAFSQTNQDMGLTHLVTHEISLKDTTPVRIPTRRIPPHLQKQVDEQLDDMLAKNLIRPCYSTYSTPLVIVPKKDGSIRIVSDFRVLNSRVNYYPYPLPNIQETFAQLSGSKYFSSLDLNSGYWQVPIKEEHKFMTAFSTLTRGQFEYQVMAQGLSNAPGTFQRLMNLVLMGIQHKFAMSYIDDIVTYSEKFEDHLGHLQEVFQRLISAGLKLRPKKCNLFQKELKYLGHIVGREGIRTDPAKIEAIQSWPTPKEVKELRSFLGLCNYYCRFVKNYAEAAHPLFQLTKKGIQNFREKWTKKHDEAFQQLKQRMTSTEVLAYPEFSENENVRMVLDTDASEDRIGACLGQIQSDGVERPIAYFSRAMKESEKRYPITRKELLALVDGMKHFRFYLIGKRFLARTDHKAILWLLRQTEAQGILGRWIERLSEFQYDIEHRSGAKHSNADGLSRRPSEPPVEQKDAKIKENEAEIPKMTIETSAVKQVVTNSVKDQSCQTDFTEEYESDSEDEFADDEYEDASDQFEDNDDIYEDARDYFEEEETVCRKLLTDYLSVPLKKEQLTSAQHADPSIRTLMDWKQKKVREPKLPENASGELKKMVKFYEQMKIEDEMLTVSEDGKRKVVLPERIEKDVFKELHDSPLAGHLGRDKTLQRVRDRFWRPGLVTAVEKYIAECIPCLESKSGNKVRAPVQTFPICEPFHRLHIDLIGPISKESRRGHRYVLTVVDSTTKFPFAFPVRNQKSATVIKTIQERIFSEYGQCQWIHTDNGKTFVSHQFQAFCTLYGIKHTCTTPYHAQSNGLVERFNKQIKSIVTCLIEKDHSDWDLLIPAALVAVRTSVNQTTGFTPHYLLFGREADLPIDSIVKRPRLYRDYPSYVLDHAKRIEETKAIVRRQLEKVREKRQEDEVENRQPKNVPVGCLALINNPQLHQEESHKFHRKKRAAYRVLAKISDTVFRVQREINGERSGEKLLVHRNNLTPVPKSEIDLPEEINNNLKPAPVPTKKKEQPKPKKRICHRQKEVRIPEVQILEEESSDEENRIQWRVFADPNSQSENEGNEELNSENTERATDSDEPSEEEEGALELEEERVQPENRYNFRMTQRRREREGATGFVPRRRYAKYLAP